MFISKPRLKHVIDTIKRLHLFKYYKFLEHQNGL